MVPTGITTPQRSRTESVLSVLLCFGFSSWFDLFFSSCFCMSTGRSILWLCMLLNWSKANKIFPFHGFHINFTPRGPEPLHAVKPWMGLIMGRKGKWSGGRRRRWSKERNQVNNKKKLQEARLVLYIIMLSHPWRYVPWRSTNYDTLFDRCCHSRSHVRPTLTHAPSSGWGWVAPRVSFS